MAGLSSMIIILYFHVLGGTRSGLYTGISLGLIMGSTYATYALTIW